MPDENPKYYAVLTEAGAQLEARALAEGRGVVLTHIVVGDANGEDVEPTSAIEALVHEVCRRPIEYRTVDEMDPNITLLHAIIPASVGGFWVRELGVIGHLEELPEDKPEAGVPDSNPSLASAPARSANEGLGDASPSGGEGVEPPLEPVHSSTEVLYAYANHAPYYKMLPQDGQTVTHEITVPILQSTDARLTIEVSEEGYVTRKELNLELDKIAALQADSVSQLLRLSSRVTTHNIESKYKKA